MDWIAWKIIRCSAEKKKTGLRLWTYEKEFLRYKQAREGGINSLHVFIFDGIWEHKSEKIPTQVIFSVIIHTGAVKH